jgi:predicted butyrate kinase (DUF1464 family)
MNLLLSNTYVAHVTNNYKLSYDVRKNIVTIINIVTDRVYVIIKVREKHLPEFFELVNSSLTDFVDLRGFVENVTIYN